MGEQEADPKAEGNPMAFDYSTVCTATLVISAHRCAEDVRTLPHGPWRLERRRMLSNIVKVLEARGVPREALQSKGIGG